MDDCIFCKIAKKEVPAKIEFENDDLIVFHDNKPIAPTHVLIVPKKHIVNLSEISEADKDLMAEILLNVRKVAEKLGILKAFRIAVANGEGAGQSVFHLHFHLTGGWDGKFSGDTDKA